MVFYIFLTVISILIIIHFLQFCFIPFGYVGIKVSVLKKSHSDPKILYYGIHFKGLFNEINIFPILQQKHFFSKDQYNPRYDRSLIFQTMDGIKCCVSIGIHYHLDASKVNALFQKHGRWINEDYIRNITQGALIDQARFFSISDIFGDQRANFLEESKNKIKDQLIDIGIVIESLYFIGEIEIPEIIIDSLNYKEQSIHISEQKENELRGIEAEAKKAIILASSEKESNTIISESINNNILNNNKIKKWNGVLPKFQGNSNTFMELK